MGNHIFGLNILFTPGLFLCCCWNLVLFFLIQVSMLIYYCFKEKFTKVIINNLWLFPTVQTTQNLLRRTWQHLDLYIFIIFSRTQQILLLSISLWRKSNIDAHTFLRKVLLQSRSGGLSYLWSLNSYSLNIPW